MTSPLEGRTALVTGASRGIGEAVARALAGAGAHPWLMARSADRIDEIAREIGGSALPTDVGDAGSVQASVTRFVTEAGGAPDVLVNAAGVFTLASIAETDLDNFDANLRINLRGAFVVVNAVLPHMLDRGRGLVVNVGSVAGRKAFPHNGAYSASKFGLRGMHEVLLEELRGTGVRASLIEPAACDTPLWDPLDPDLDPHLPSRSAMLRPEDVAEAVLFLATRPDDVQIPLLSIEHSSRHS